MSDWVGFSDADLRRMKGTTDSNRNGAKIVKPITGSKTKQGSNLGQKPQKRQNSKFGSRAQKKHEDVPSEAMLSQAPSKQDSSKNTTQELNTTNETIPLHGKTCNSPIESSAEVLASDTIVESKEPEILDDADVIKEKEKIKLEDIQRRQKEMEEKNKRKKTMLTKAIAERKKRAFAESTKLVKIQAELTKLDGMLNYDVSILRDRIDEACVDYNHAQKRFEKAEAEYVSAKMSLHKATEMKEELTEHLFHLIQLNEERKANKLEELMQKLELEESGELDETVEEIATDSKITTASQDVSKNTETNSTAADSSPSTTVKEADNSDTQVKEHTENLNVETKS